MTPGPNDTAGLPYLEPTILATSRYLGALTELSAEELEAPSLLPGWTRAHVVSHLSRNADGLVRLLHAAQSGEDLPMYDSQEARDADIEAGSRRTPEEIVADAVASSGRWIQAANELHAAKLESPVRRTPGAETFPVRRVGTMRLTEVAVHHADLDIGYTAADWPHELVAHLLHRRERELRDKGIGVTVLATDTAETWSTGDGPRVSGSAAELAWWLTGRGDGASLDVDGELPDLGRWA
jgi:maleylpyruvate isomerase